jgi:hypothetical protein
MSDDTDRYSRLDLIKQADAILRRARFDVMTGAQKDRAYRLNKRAESKRRGRYGHAKRNTLGKFGAASPVRVIAPKT